MSRLVESVIKFPYTRSLGPVIGTFMTGLTEKRLLGIRNGDGVLFPPMEWDPATGDELAHDFVEVGPAGTVEAWTWVPVPTEQHPLDRPFAFAHIRLDGASTPFLHAVDAGSIDAMSEGMRVAPRWKGTRIGHITDVACFVPGETSEVDGEDTGPAAQPIGMMDYVATITYRNPVPPTNDLIVELSKQKRFIGFHCPVCDKTYFGGRAICPIDAVEFTESHAVDLPHTGTITNFVVITPVQYPGQTETEPFARVFVLLDGTDVIVSYQAVIELPAAEVRVGRRVAAVWASEAEDTEGNPLGQLIGWMPLDEPDVDDPDLVNRIF